MGQRILAFMQANNIHDLQEFAEGVLGIPPGAFEDFLYVAADVDSLPLRPMLLMSEALGTNVEFLTCLSDDPRPGVMLTYDEHVLLQCWRDLGVSPARARLLEMAQRLVGEMGAAAKPNRDSPFPHLPVRRRPPANEM